MLEILFGTINYNSSVLLVIAAPTFNVRTVEGLSVFGFRAG